MTASDNLEQVLLKQIAVNVLASTTSTGNGDVYIQISGPSSLSWIGLGQGTSMSGANLFMVYANSAGNNVTVSPRLGIGERQPKTGSTTNVTLLDGSGISNGMITANVGCALSHPISQGHH